MVTLLCPAVKTPKLSKFMEAVLNGGDIHDWLVPESEEQVRITDPAIVRRGSVGLRIRLIVD